MLPGQSSRPEVQSEFSAPQSFLIQSSALRLRGAGSHASAESSATEGPAEPGGVGEGPDGADMGEGPDGADLEAQMKAFEETPEGCPDVRAALQEAADEEGYVLPLLPKHFGVPKTAQEASASLSAPASMPAPPVPRDDTNACEEDWPRDPISGQRRFGEWFYQYPVGGLGDQSKPIQVPGAHNAHVINAEDFEDVEVRKEDLNERLLYAALTSQHTWIHELVALGAEINVARDTAFGNATPLHCSAVSNDLPTATALLACGADVRILNAFRQTCLHLAAYYGHTQLLLRLYRRGALHPPTHTDAAAMRKRKGGGGGAGLALHSEARALLSLKDVHGYSALEYAESENRSETANAIRQLLGMPEKAASSTRCF